MGVAELECVTFVEAVDDAPLLHVFPGHERGSDPPVPIGAVARCGYVCRGLKEVTVPHGSASPDYCVVCDGLP